jgi:hypothetical protein
MIPEETVHAVIAVVAMVIKGALDSLTGKIWNVHFYGEKMLWDAQFVCEMGSYTIITACQDITKLLKPEGIAEWSVQQAEMIAVQWSMLKGNKLVKPVPESDRAVIAFVRYEATPNVIVHIEVRGKEPEEADRIHEVLVDHIKEISEVLL